jgi:hypothetical protein
MNRTIYAALLLASTALATLPARADVILDPHLSGTGDNVIFDSVDVANFKAFGSLNGQHINIVDFTDLSHTANFTGSANGNDIKLDNTSNLFIQVFDSTNTTVVGTLTDVFSLKGTGDVTAFIQASLNGVPEAIKSFDLGTIDPNAQSGFTFSAINGEVMTSIRLFDTGGSIAEFEHYRIDVAPSVAVPGPIVGAGIPGLVAACGGLFGLNFWRRRRNGATLSA